ncbi:nuclear transport factor 2 family protein [Hydrogenophaga sp. 5NK40-0174]|uniref:YybH family protein n=1 Tax=Hydrogenophaga sp. 5NK40-0174 TaxID=3127649 RepID=UPI00310AA3A2
MSDTDTASNAARQLITSYNRAFMARDLATLRSIYVEDAGGQFSYFDNHAGCDASSLDEHLQQLETFFASGEPIGGLDIEHLHPHLAGSPPEQTLVITARVRYRQHTERPTVRMTVVATQVHARWRICHMHFSDMPATL